MYLILAKLTFVVQRKKLKYNSLVTVGFKENIEHLFLIRGKIIDKIFHREQAEYYGQESLIFCKNFHVSLLRINHFHFQPILL